MARLCSFWVVLCLFTTVAAVEPFRIVFYNVENFFDCRHDSLKADYEFLPSGIRRWGAGRMYVKALHLGKAIAAAGRHDFPDLVGMCEVENDSCLELLLRRTPLQRAHYRYVMTDSPDERGIDVALLYRRGSFRLIGSTSYRIPPIGPEWRATRDILHATGSVITGDTLDVLVCHLPSRAHGAASGQRFRMWAAQRLRSVTDSIQALRQHAHIVVMGDFNDFPGSAVLRVVEGADRACGALCDLLSGKKPGTYRYQGQWNTLDHLLVSECLLDRHAPLHTHRSEAGIVWAPFLMEPDETYGGVKPFRTFSGWRYHEGYSDHLPVYLDLHLTPCGP